jgi:hypothetical protein
LKESLKKLFSSQTFQKSLSSSSIKGRSIEKKERKRSIEDRRERKKSSKCLSLLKCGNLAISFEKGEFNILRGRKAPSAPRLEEGVLALELQTVGDQEI